MPLLCRSSRNSTTIQLRKVTGHAVCSQLLTYYTVLYAMNFMNMIAMGGRNGSHKMQYCRMYLADRVTFKSLYNDMIKQIFFQGSL